MFLYKTATHCASQMAIRREHLDHGKPRSRAPPFRPPGPPKRARREAGELLHPSTKPTHLPKIQIQFVDFPWPRSPKHHRLLVSETSCGFRYGKGSGHSFHPRVGMDPSTANVCNAHQAPSQLSHLCVATQSSKGASRNSHSEYALVETPM